MYNIRKEEDNNITLLIPEKLIFDNTFSNYALAVYCVLRILSQPTQMPTLCVTQQQVEFYLTGQLSNRRLMSDYIKCGINELIDNHIVEKIDVAQKHFILDCSNLLLNKTAEHFTIITFGEVQKIFSLKNINNFLLLKYFVSLIWTISSKITVYLPSGEFKNRVVGNYTIDYLSELSGMSVRTVIEYNKLLEEAGLIYIYRQGDFIIDKEKNIKRLNNVYGRASDIDYIIAFAKNQQKHYETYNHVKNNTIKANNKRRLAQMYQQILKNNDKNYTDEEIISVYEYIVSENEKYEHMYEKTQYENYLFKIRDIDVFKKYDFLSDKL